MLDAHPNLAIPGESHVIPKLWREQRRYMRGPTFSSEEFLIDMFRSPLVKEWGLTLEDIRAHVGPELQALSPASVIRASYETYARKAGKPFWGDKTPAYALHVPLLARIFPDARFIHIIRDGRDVALSYLDLPGYPRTLWQAAIRWKERVRAARLAGPGLGKERYSEVRYESLVADPEGVLRDLCQFLGLEFSSRVLEHDGDAASRLETPPRFLIYHRTVGQPVRSGARDWRVQMQASDVLAFEAIGGSLLSELGYERRFPHIPLRWRAAAALQTSMHHSRRTAALLRDHATSTIRSPLTNPTASLTGYDG
jgi:hypothetical protein